MPGWDDAMLDGMRLVGDPLADDVVAGLFDENDVDAARRLLRGLIDQPDVAEGANDAEVDLEEYLAVTSVLPDWVDVERLHRGQDVFERWGVPISVALFCASLPSAYACARGVQVLNQTARLETDTRRRIMETGQFLIDVLGPGGLDPGGKGIAAIQRVRLMHAAVRFLVLAHQRAVAAGDDRPGPPPWDDEWGLPINQEDLAGTLMSFSYTVVGPLPHLGVEVDAQDQEDYLYVWQVVGTMLGLREEMIPTDIAESTELVEIIRRRNYAHSEAGVAMTKALVELLEEMTPLRIFDAVPVDLIRMLIGDEASDLLELPPSSRRFGWWTHLKVVFRFTTREVENNRILQGLANRLGWIVLNGVFEIERDGEGRTNFEIPDQLAERWQLEPSGR